MFLGHPYRRSDGEPYGVELDAAQIKPQVTWGTSPEMVAAIDAIVPDPALEKDPVKREGMERALQYMGLAPGEIGDDAHQYAWVAAYRDKWAEKKAA